MVDSSGNKNKESEPQVKQTNNNNLEVPRKPSRKYGTVQQPKNTVLLQPPTPPGLPSGGSPVLSVVFSDPHLKLPCSTLKPVRKWSAPCLSFRKKRYDNFDYLVKIT